MCNKWDQRYLAQAKEISSWSKDPSSKVGAIAVGKHGQILSQGYNGFPRGIKDLNERYADRETKYKYVVHAEMNCIYNACLNGVSLENSCLYIYGRSLCPECTKGVIQVGVAKVIMQHAPYPKEDKWEKHFHLTEEMLNEVGIDYKRYDLTYAPM